MFEFLDMIVVRPIVNILFVIYNFVGDFGLAIIIFTIIVKFAMWPLVKKQLHQTRLMRKIQPELAEIKKNCKGNRQLESLQMMDLYKRNNIKPFRSILTLLIQLPIFIALFTAINVMVQPKLNDYDTVDRYAYSFVRPLERIDDLASKQQTYFDAADAYINREDKEDGAEPPVLDFDAKLFNFIDLNARATSSIPIMLFALVAAFGQYFMAKQQNPSAKKRRTFKQIMSDAKEGKEADQAELNAMVSGQMTKMMPIMMLLIMINLPGALVFYYMLSNLLTVVQQKIVLGKAGDEMEQKADKAIIKQLNKIEEAQVVDGAKPAKKSKTNITRISASNKKRRKK